MQDLDFQILDLDPKSRAIFASLFPLGVPFPTDNDNDHRKANTHDGGQLPRGVDGNTIAIMGVVVGRRLLILSEHVVSGQCVLL